MQSSLNASTGPFGSGPRWSPPRRSGTARIRLAVDPATHTIYVANGYNDNGPDGRRRHGLGDRHTALQRPRRLAVQGSWPTITVGNLPSGIAINQATDTVYVSERRRQHRVGVQRRDLQRDAQRWLQPDAGDGAGRRRSRRLFADPANHTVYVATSATRQQRNGPRPCR